MPVLVTDLAQIIYPSPSALAYATAEMDAARQMPTVEERRAVVRARLLKQYGGDSLRDLPVDPIGIELMEEERESEPLFHSLVAEVYDSHERQSRVYRFAGMLTPLLAIQPLSMSVSGTGLAEHRDFADAVERYRQRMMQIINEAIAYNPKYGESKVFPGTDIIVAQAGRELWQRVPQFSYEPRALRERLAPSSVSLLVLCVWLLFAGWFLWRSVSRLAVV